MKPNRVTCFKCLNAHNTNITRPFVCVPLSPNAGKLGGCGTKEQEGIFPSLLKHCTSQLSGVFTKYSVCLFSNVKIPHCFKKSTIIPVPNKCTASLNDYRPIALTSVVMKTLECLVLQFLKSIIDPLLDRFQFACHENRCVDDAVSLGFPLKCSSSWKYITQANTQLIISTHLN